MREIRTPSLKVVLVTIFIALLTTVIPILATDYTVGVKAGNWVKYGEINVSWNGTGTEPSYITDARKIDWVKVEVKSVSGTEVTIETTGQYKNETTTPSSNSTIDVATGSYMLIAANLEEGDNILQQSGPAIKINGTVSRTYCGASRSVNFVNITVSYAGTTIMYWDKATGVMVELYMSSSQTIPTVQSITMSYKATETNMWSSGGILSDIFNPTSPNFIYIIIGIAALVVVIVLGVFIVRRRKPTPTVTPTPTAVEETPATPA
jgi:hypothetical protein